VLNKLRQAAPLYRVLIGCRVSGAKYRAQSPHNFQPFFTLTTASQTPIHHKQTYHAFPSPPRQISKSSKLGLNTIKMSSSADHDMDMSVDSSPKGKGKGPASDVPEHEEAEETSEDEEAEDAGVSSL
jgi:hypothetical protein